MAHVNTVQGNSFAAITTLDTSSALTVAVGDIVCVYVQHERTAAALQYARLSDNLGNIFVPVDIGVNDPTDEQRSSTFASRIAVAGSCTPRATFSATVNNSVLLAGQYAGRDVSGAAPQFYSNLFTATENPLTDGGQLHSQGANETPCKTVSGAAYGTQAGGSFDDSEAYLTGFSPNHHARAVIKLAGGIVGHSQEVELLLSWSFGASYDPGGGFGNTEYHGYEINAAWDGAYMNVGRFKGAAIATITSWGTPADGDVFEAEITTDPNGDRRIKVWWNEVLLITVVDTDAAKRFTTGSPGLGFFIDAGANNTDFGFNSYEAWDVVSAIDQHTLIKMASTGTGTDAVTTGNVTTTADGEDIVGFAGVADNIFNNQFTAGTGFTRRITVGDGSNNLSAASEDKPQSVAGPVAATWTQANTAIPFVGVITLKPATAAPSSSGKRYDLNTRPFAQRLRGMTGPEGLVARAQRALGSTVLPTPPIPYATAARYDLSQLPESPRLRGMKGPWGIVAEAQRALGSTVIPASGGTTFLQSISGAMTPAGSIAKSGAKALTGGATSAGALTRAAAKALAGGITPSGVLTRLKVALITLGGTLTSAGAMVRAAGKSVGGSVGPTGALQKAGTHTMAGTATSGGSLTKLPAKVLAGTVASSGTMARLVKVVKTGTMAATGSLAKAMQKALAGALSFAGSFISNLGGPTEVIRASKLERLGSDPVIRQISNTPTIRPFGDD